MPWIQRELLPTYMQTDEVVNQLFVRLIDGKEMVFLPEIPVGIVEQTPAGQLVLHINLGYKTTLRSEHIPPPGIVFSGKVDIMGDIINNMSHYQSGMFDLKPPDDYPYTPKA